MSERKDKPTGAAKGPPKKKRKPAIPLDPTLVGCGHGKDCTPLEREARLVRVEHLLYRLIKEPPAVERQCALEFGVGRRAIRTYMKRVRDRQALRSATEPDPFITRGKLTANVLHLQGLALSQERIVDGVVIAVPDVRTALRCALALADLHGMRVQRHEITGPDGAPLTVSPGDAAAELMKEIDRRASRKATDGEPENQ